MSRKSRPIQAIAAVVHGYRTGGSPQHQSALPELPTPPDSQASDANTVLVRKAKMVGIALILGVNKRRSASGSRVVTGFFLASAENYLIHF